MTYSLWLGDDTHKLVGVLDARLGMAGLLATSSADPFDVRPGILFAGNQSLVSTRADLKVDVGDFHAVVVKDRTNGPYVYPHLGTTTVTVPAAPALGFKRTDLLWFEQHDVNAVIDPDADFLPTFGVVSGAAVSTGSPAKPAVPAGATEVGTITWDSTSVVATATNAAQCTVATTCQWTAARGAAIAVRSATERDDTLTGYEGLQVIRLDRAGLIETHDGAGWRGARKTYSPAWTADTVNPNRGTDGSVSGAYTESGDMVDAVIVVKMGTTGVAQGTGSYALTLPVPADLTEPFALNGAALYTTGGNNYVLIPSPLDATRIRVMVNADNDPWAPLVPAAITTGAVMRVAVRYRRA